MKAYGCVWPDGLFLKMTRKGIPQRFAQWAQRWLANRRSFVTVDDSRSRSRTYNVWLPQGSVIAPIMFLIYIDDIVERLPLEVSVSMYAEDVALWSQHDDRYEAAGYVQTALNKADAWGET